eukprot:scaffold25865_cov31-Tisochrysis_lutea.AAC.1
MAAPPPWRQALAPSGQLHLISVECDDDHIAARITDLRGWWEGRLAARAVDAQRAACSISSSTPAVLALIARCYAGEEAQDEYRFIIQCPNQADEPLRLSWWSKVLSITIECQPHADPAAKLRDELLLPLLRGVELLEGLVPGDIAASWFLSPAATKALPLPNFHRPIVKLLLTSATSANEAPPTCSQTVIGLGGSPLRPGATDADSDMSSATSSRLVGLAPACDSMATSNTPSRVAVYKGLQLDAVEARRRKQMMKRERAAAGATANQPPTKAAKS